MPGSMPGHVIVLGRELKDANGRDKPGHRVTTKLKVERSALHEHRAGALRALALGHHAETLGDLGVGLDQPAHVAAETILVELLARLDVPQPATVGRDFVGYDDAH